MTFSQQIRAFQMFPASVALASSFRTQNSSIPLDIVRILVENALAETNVAPELRVAQPRILISTGFKKKPILPVSYKQLLYQMA